MTSRRLRRAERETIVFLPDIHFPHQDPAALSAAKALIHDLKPETVVILGDLIDCYTLSRFAKDPSREKGLQAEIDEARTFLEWLRATVPDATILYKEGNHEERLQRYLWSKAPDLDLRCLELSELLGLEELAIEWYGSKRRCEMDGLVITHGDIVRQRAGYTAHGMMWHRGCSGISGHTHRLADVNHTTSGGQKRWIEAGCLCDLSPSYVGDKRPDWQHGLVVGHRIQSRQLDRLDLTLVPITHGVAHYAGRYYLADEVITP